jgi:hypothetical protein
VVYGREFESEEGTYWRAKWIERYVDNAGRENLYNEISWRKKRLEIPGHLHTRVDLHLQHAQEGIERYIECNWTC